jgi:phosphopantothenoylcysteine decarboxylase/phosphopantothenate--cysteine ligase
VLGVTGGIAAYKAVLAARLLVRSGADVQVVLTRGGAAMVGAPTFAGITGNPVRTSVWEGIEDDTHVALARGADVLGVYPCTAHTMARLAGGLADDLLTTSVLAATCPVVVAPAMHGEMWDHPATRRNAATLRADGVRLVGPATGELMGGDAGTGRVVEPEQFVSALADALAGVAGDDLAGRTVVVTAGGTREPLDPVRFLGNRSSGRMGFAVAAAAAARGATVHLVACPTELATPPGVQRHDVVTARDLRDAVVPLALAADVVVKAAAVADFRPATVAASKIKKNGGVPAIELVANPDVLAELGAARRDGATHPTVLVGFAAETDDVEANGRAKLAAKGADLLVVNDVRATDAGFGTDTNRVVLLGTQGEREALPLQSKLAVAHRLLDRVVALLAQDAAG